MFLGYLIGGMFLGLVSAGCWVIAGGSILAAVGVYSLVGTLFVLVASGISVALAALHTFDEAEARSVITPAE